MTLIDADYLRGALEELSRIGYDAERGGYYRLAWSRHEREAHQWFRDKLEALGLRVWTDGAGNSFGQWDAGEGSALAIGSHLDSVPSGGNYDGGLGVVSALATVKALRDNGCQPVRPIRVAAFTDEEGPRLEKDGLDIGVVTDITGIAHLVVSFPGVANHAGTTPKEDRHSALVAASRFIVSLEDFIANRPQLVGNVGAIEVHPNAVNVIPAMTVLRIDLRSPQEQELEAAVDWVRKHARIVNHAVTVSLYHYVPPAPMHAPWLPIIEREADRLGYSHTRLVSWAGHAAGILSSVMPAAMLFVPSRAGISHAPEEWAAFDDVLQGAEVLAAATQTLSELAEGGRP